MRHRRREKSGLLKKAFITEAYYREIRANETPKEREERLRSHRAYYREKRANETPEEREKRLAKRREYQKKRRSNG